MREKKEEAPERQDAGEEQVPGPRDQYMSDFGNRTYGPQYSEYGTFGGQS